MQSTARERGNTTPLRVRPVKLRDSLYLLIPVDIARLVGVVSSSSFRLKLDEDQATIRLVYEMKKDDEGDGKSIATHDSKAAEVRPE